MTDRDRYIAVFGDTHGHLRLMFQLCRLWQMNNGRHLDGILQAGDLGFFPDVTRLDKATKRFSRRDPEELGFSEYFRLPQPLQRDEWLERTLNGDPESLETVRSHVVWCHGNHEDFATLEAVTCGAVLSPVDAFGRLHYLRSGEVTDVAGIVVGAVGGAPEVAELPTHSGSVIGRAVNEQATRRLSGQSMDVLLTHGAPVEIGGESDRFGSALLRRLVESHQPAYHFFGHHSEPILAARIGRTQCVWLNDTTFCRTRDGNCNGPVEPGCMAVLRWRSPEDSDLTVINDAWFRQITAPTWRHH